MVQDRVWVFAGRNRGFNLESLQIEHGNLGRPTFTDETDAQIQSHGHAVNSRSVRYVANDGASLGIQNGDMGSSGDVDSVRLRVDGDAVPSSAACQGQFFHNLMFS